MPTGRRTSGPRDSGTANRRARPSNSAAASEKSMSTQHQVETVSSAADKAKLGGSVMLLLASIVAYYYLGRQDLWVRVVALLVLLAIAVALFLTSELGKQFIAFGRDSLREVRKVVWPTRKDAIQMTGYVFAFVAAMALYMWLTDKILEWGLYDLILGWRR
jgi:preprotein translocase subunit SecE